MKKTIKYTLITLSTLFILIVFVLPMLIGGTGKDSNTNDKFADTAIYQISSYYFKNGYYPQTLEELPLYSNQEFISYIQSNRLKYNSYGVKKEKYVFSWIGGAMNWTGYSCTNDKYRKSKQQETIVRSYILPDGSVCTVTDLH